MTGVTCGGPQSHHEMYIPIHFPAQGTHAMLLGAGACGSSCLAMRRAWSSWQPARSWAWLHGRTPLSRTSWPLCGGCPTGSLWSRPSCMGDGFAPASCSLMHHDGFLNFLLVPSLKGCTQQCSLALAATLVYTYWSSLLQHGHRALSIKIISMIPCMTESRCGSMLLRSCFAVRCAS